MLKKAKVTEVTDEGFVALLGERITLFCGNYIYTGNLEGVNEEYVKLTDAAIVYETGPFNSEKWQDAQTLPKPVYIMKNAIESFMILKIHV